MGACARPTPQVHSTRLSPDYRNISRLLSVVAQVTVRKWHIELVVDMPKDTPLVLTHYAVVIGKGQYIPERGLPVFSTAPGQVGLEMVTALPKRSSPLVKIAKQNRGEKTDCTIYSKKKGAVFPLPAKAWESPHRRF